MKREFTGRHMLYCLLGFFAAIVAVNVTMATLATQSWSGLVVKNSYVASQDFDTLEADRAAREAHGWTSEPVVGLEGVTVRFSKTNGPADTLDRATVTLRRPTHEHDDRTLALAPLGDGVFRIETSVAPGTWLAEVRAMQAGELVYLGSFRFFLERDNEG